ncbi:MAG TPA: hypothetical protein PKY59_04845 [Pyrinomonadaceae bacterium]|nr:hypothetical protein [Pyrinomonadaceae bacterium]
MKKVLFLLVFGLFSFAAAVSAQPRPPESAKETKAADVKPAPESFEVRYEGGMFGYEGKAHGTLKFDDVNERLVFYGEDKKEMFAIPYSTMLIISPSSKKVQSGTGRAISAVPIFGAGLGGSLLKKTKNYMIIQFRDQEVDVTGAANFLIDTNELLESAIHTLGQKAEMKQRGNAYYRPAPPRKTDL